MAYEVGQVPDNPALLPAFLRDELLRIQQAFYGPQKVVWLAQSAAAPLKPRDGMAVNADGVNFKPNGSGGAGFWRYDGATATWINLG